jgi:hypothetical protein
MKFCANPRMTYLSKPSSYQIIFREREKESKNIRRRVYDALNVLVSVGILGKEQRCVIHTQFTSVPGKKLSAHWQAITTKQRYLTEQ